MLREHQKVVRLGAKDSLTEGGVVPLTILTDNSGVWTEEKDIYQALRKSKKEEGREKTTSGQKCQSGGYRGKPKRNGTKT